MRERERERERENGKKEGRLLPNIVAVKAVDENVAAEVEEVDGGSSHRHL